MQTIKITITSSIPTDIVFKECSFKQKDIASKIRRLLKNFNAKEEIIKNE